MSDWNGETNIGYPIVNDIDEELLQDNDSISSQDILHTGEKNPRYAPPDRYNVAFILMMILGMGTAYAWNFFITAADYFHYAFRNITNPEFSTTYQSVFENTLALVATSCGLLGIIVNTLLSRYIFFKYRIYAGFLVIFVVFIVTTALAKVNTDFWQTGFFVVTMINVFIINFASNMVCGGLFGVQGCLPSRYATAMMAGQTLAGICASLASVFAVLAEGGVGNQDAGVRNEAAGYFGSAIAAVVLFMISFRVFLSLPVVNYYLKPTVVLKNFEGNGSVESINSLPVVVVKEPFPFRLVMQRTWQYAVVLSLTLLATLALYPAVASTVRSVHASDGALVNNGLFLPLSCFLIMNMGDLTGRLAHGFLQFPNTQQGSLSLIIAVLRLGFIPLMLFCNAQPRSHLPVSFGDAGFVTILAAMGFSNGYLVNLGMMYGPKLVPPQFAETTGSLLGICINTGLVIGSALSFLLIWCL